MKLYNTTRIHWVWHNGYIHSIKDDRINFSIKMCDSPDCINMNDYVIHNIPEIQMRPISNLAQTKKYKKSKKSKKCKKSKKSKKYKKSVKDKEKKTEFLNNKINNKEWVKQEVRRDPEDGELYTKQEFFNFYDGLSEWKEARAENKHYIYTIYE